MTAPDTALGQVVRDTQGECAEGTQQPSSHGNVGSTHTLNAAGSTVPPATKGEAIPKTFPSLADPILALLADNLDDLERTRIANENRVRQLTRDEADSDGENRGFGLTADNPVVAQLEAVVQSLAALEHGATLALQRQLKRHPLGPWVKATVGVGPKQGARLLAATGDPWWNTLHNRPRTVSELWAYCGLHVLPASHHHHDAQGGGAGGAQSSNPGHSLLDTQSGSAGVAAKRRKGQKANWSATAKMRAYLVATSCIKQADSPYRTIYLARREHTTVTHPDWTKGHSHNDGLRIVSKAVLKDLWIAARAIHQQS